jgi:hypothetical protein
MSTKNPNKLQAEGLRLGRGLRFLVKKSYTFSLAKLCGLELKYITLKCLKESCSAQRYVGYIICRLKPKFQFRVFNPGGRHQSKHIPQSF